MTNIDDTQTLYDNLSRADLIELCEEHRGEIHRLVERIKNGPPMPTSIAMLCVEIDELKRDLDTATSQVADYQEAARIAAEEDCSGEKHCTCVPLLRQKIAEQQAEIKHFHPMQLPDQSAMKFHLRECIAEAVAEREKELVGLRAEVESLRPQAAFIATCCDEPADRMYHAADGTWWQREGLRWKVALAPEPLLALQGHLAVLVEEIRQIAEESILPDGDGVTVPVALWAESVLEKFAALTSKKGGGNAP